MSTQQTATTTLVIDNFSKRTDNDYKRIDFPFVGLSYFGIYPRVDIPIFTDDNVFVYWINNDKICAKVHFKVSILSASNEKLYTTEYNWQFDDSNVRSAAAFISRTKLLDPKNGYLVNDKLTLLCEAETIDRMSVTLQQDLNNLSVDFSSLLIDGKLSDVTLTVGSDGKHKFKAHKTILSARSPVFAAMFEHDCKEKRQNEVNITDIDFETADELLRYIYTGKVAQMDRYACDLLQAADKYQLDSLKNICEDYLGRTLSIESAANVLCLANLHQAIKLKNKCLEYICVNENRLKGTDGWTVLESNAKLLTDLFFYLANKNK